MLHYRQEQRHIAVRLKREVIIFGFSESYYRKCQIVRVKFR